MDVAIVACRDYGTADPSALFPDPDGPRLEAAFARAGARPAAVAWDDDRVDWGRFDVAVIRSTWSSVDHPDAYLRWVRAAGAVTRLVNPAEAVAWNLDKRYLRALEARGVPVVPTAWVQTADEWDPPGSEFVVKPSVSGGGRETARYCPDEAAAAGEHVHRLLGRGLAVMVQPYLAAVERQGETKLIFIAGAFSHAVRAGAQLAAGRGVLERAWEHLAPVAPTLPTPARLEAAERVLAAVDAELGLPLAYARVDLVPGAAGEPLLSEVELIDPSLFLRHAPPAADRLAAAVLA